MKPTATILHADMDAFYAAVEQRDDPRLAGCPVVIGGLGRRGVVATASYEARRFGVHSAQPMARARRLCPQACFLRPRMEVYARVSAQVRQIFEAFTDLVEPISLDEAFLDVSGSQRLFGSGPGMARGLRRRVLEETGLTVSVGVASSKFVAKVASDLHKPDALTTVPAGSEAAFLAPLPSARLWGAGPATQMRLAAIGCHTLGQIQRCGAARLAQALGERLGAQLQALSLGIDPRPVSTGGGPVTVGRETTFEHDLSSEENCRGVLLELAEDVGRRLRQLGLGAATVRLKLRHPPFETHTHQQRLPWPCADDSRLYAGAVELFLGAWKGRPVRLLGVTGADLATLPGEHQAELFGWGEGPARAVDATLDRIRARYGAGAVRRLGRREP